MATFLGRSELHEHPRASVESLVHFVHVFSKVSPRTTFLLQLLLACLELDAEYCESNVRPRVLVAKLCFD